MYMNLVPVAVIVLLILGAGYLMTKGELKIPGFGDELEVRRIKGFPTVVSTSAMIEKKREVIKSQERLNEFLDEIDPSGVLAVNDKIDFGSEYVLAAATETRDTSGYEIRIRRVYKNQKDDTLRVSVKEQRPGEGCEVEEEQTVAVDLIAITKTDKEIGFEVAKQINNCEVSE